MARKKAPKFKSESFGSVTLYLGDCRDVMASIEPDRFHAAVTDPPYELGFMGKSWDSSGVASTAATWEAVARTLRPGAHLAAFAGSRTYHRIAGAIDDAGFEIRDMLLWMYGSGFPKSMDIAKCIDKWGGYIGGRPASRYPAIQRRRCCAGTNERRRALPSSMTLSDGKAGARH